MLRSSSLRPALAALLFGALVTLAVRTTLGARLERADFAFVNGAEIESLDPATITGVPGGRVVYSIFEGLVIKDPETLEPIPGVAERWELSDDGRTYTFHLREDARWTRRDGSVVGEVTAEDFVASFRRFLHPETAAVYAYLLWYVRGAREYSTELDAAGEPLRSFADVGIHALDAHTLEIELTDPTPYFLSLLTFYPLFPVHVASLEEARRRWPETWRMEWMRPENLVTNGPFVLEERRINDRIRLRKNEHYWDADAVAFETIDALACESYFTMLNLYLTGEVDWIDKVAPTAVPRLLETDAFQPRPYLNTYFFRVNVTRAPFDDPQLRRALSLAIPRQRICEGIMKAGQQPAFSLVPPLAGYRSAEMRHTPFPSSEAVDAEAAFAVDCEEARRVLAEAGYGTERERPTIELHYNTSEAHRDIAEVVADSWKRELGLKVKLLNQEWKVYLDSQKSLRYDVSRAGWIGDYADPNTYLDLFVSDGKNNRTGWSDPVYDDWIARAAQELDPELRMELLRQAELHLLEALPILPVFYYVDQNVVAPRLGGFHPNAQDEHMPKFWYWMDDAELAEKRAALPEGLERSDPHGPAEGLYPPRGRREDA